MSSTPIKTRLTKPKQQIVLLDIENLGVMPTLKFIATYKKAYKVQEPFFYACSCGRNCINVLQATYLQNKTMEFEDIGKPSHDKADNCLLKKIDRIVQATSKAIRSSFVLVTNDKKLQRRFCHRMRTYHIRSAFIYSQELTDRYSFLRVM